MNLAGFFKRQDSTEAFRRTAPDGRIGMLRQFGEKRDVAVQPPTLHPLGQGFQFAQDVGDPDPDLEAQRVAVELAERPVGGEPLLRACPNFN